VTSRRPVEEKAGVVVPVHGRTSLSAKRVRAECRQYAACAEQRRKLATKVMDRYQG
jgi:hypothetical protein